MHPQTIFASFATLLTAATAVPLNARDAASNNVPTPAKAVSAVASVTQSQSATATMTPVGAYSCPQKQHKQCCQSLQQTSKDLMKPIGDLVPIVGGLEISSKISFQCMHSLCHTHTLYSFDGTDQLGKGKKMTDDEPPDNCKDPGYTPMCCKAEATQVRTRSHYPTLHTRAKLKLISSRAG